MTLALIIILCVLIFISATLNGFIGLIFSEGARKRYKILQIPDRKRHILFGWVLGINIIILFIQILLAVFDHYEKQKERELNNAIYESSKNAENNSADAAGYSKAIWRQAMEKSFKIEEGRHRNLFDVLSNRVVVFMADKARWYSIEGGDYVSYNTLWAMLEKTSDADAEFIRSEIKRLNRLLLFSYASVEQIPLCKYGKNQGNMCLEVETKENFDVNNVVFQLSHPFWVSRAKSAYLLQFLTSKQMQTQTSVTWERVLDSLYKVFANNVLNDENVLTRYMAWEAFRKISCFTDQSALFNVNDAVQWWAEVNHKNTVLNALNRGEPSPYCTQLK